MLRSQELIEFANRIGSLDGTYTREMHPTYVSNARVMSGTFANMFADVLEMFDLKTVVILLDTSGVPVYTQGASSLGKALRSKNCRVYTTNITTYTDSPFDFTDVLLYFRERSRGKCAANPLSA